MAFYTPVDETDLLVLLERYGISNLSSCTGVSDGIENTTYILQANAGQMGKQQWILTLFEDLSAAELPFFARLMTWLHERDLPVACPLMDLSGNVLQHLAGKPALLFPRLQGQHPRAIKSAHCASIGDFLGRMHKASAQYPEQRANPRGTAWMELAGERLGALLGEVDNALLQGQIANAKDLRSLGLPCGLIHGDLFHDNALFVDDNLSGVIDFYNACTDMLALDLAIVINDWCAVASGGIDTALTGILLDAYQVHRALTMAEQHHWQSILQLAASRFWLSRLLAEKLPGRPGSAHPGKPSAEYRTRLHCHLQ